MDFEDITYSIPLANIFSCLEPCIAIILSCIPLLRPLLSKTVFGTTQTGYAGNSGSSKPKSSDRAFQPLDDDSSQYKLRPKGPKHTTEISVSRPGRPSNSDDAPGSSDQDSFELRDIGSERVRRDDSRVAINVKQEWEVSNTQ